MLTLRPSTLGASQRHDLVTGFRRLCERRVRSIFEEFGFPCVRSGGTAIRRIHMSTCGPRGLRWGRCKAACPDRFGLDRVLDVLGLTEEERRDVYRAVAQLVEDRLVKARSV